MDPSVAAQPSACLGRPCGSTPRCPARERVAAIVGWPGLHDDGRRSAGSDTLVGQPFQCLKRALGRLRP
eukprot:9314360-Alexandrium_andersonii.AAC.1